MLGRMAEALRTVETEDAGAVLRAWNAVDAEAAEAAVLPCCGSRAWARGMAARRPVGDEAELLRVAAEVWAEMGEAEWMEAFAAHPRIGERKGGETRSAAWSRAEQAGVGLEEEEVAERLRVGNARYESRFGRVFLICATGRGAEEMLRELERRMGNEEAEEMHEAMREQGKITALRLRRWLAEARA